MTDIAPRIPLPRWAEISRTVFRAVTAVWSVGLLVGLIVATVRKLTGHGDFFPTSDGWTTSDVLFLLVIVLPAAVSGLLWLAGEMVRGSREPLQD